MTDSPAPAIPDLCLPLRVKHGKFIAQLNDGSDLHILSNAVVYWITERKGEVVETTITMFSGKEVLALPPVADAESFRDSMNAYFFTSKAPGIYHTKQGSKDIYMVLDYIESMRARRGAGGILVDVTFINGRQLSCLLPKPQFDQFSAQVHRYHTR